VNKELTTPLAPSTGRKVAVVGSGPAGLTAAYYLAKNGHSVTVFEATTQLGGMLTFGIPEYRLPREILQEDLDHIMKMGVEIKTAAVIGEHIKLNELRTQGYEATFVAIGAQKPKKLKIEGVELEGVLWGVDFLKQVNMGNDIEIKDRVLIVGGGNVAIDIFLMGT
jgi:NADPH-dependent glutamate synthase beta subunit-like oxidoreductase